MICPTCGSECFFCLDEWGYTPWHLHCEKCHINIGGTSQKICEDLLKEYNQPYTYLEYYNHKIQLLMISDN